MSWLLLRPTLTRPKGDLFAREAIGGLAMHEPRKGGCVGGNIVSPHD